MTTPFNLLRFRAELDVAQADLEQRRLAGQVDPLAYAVDTAMLDFCERRTVGYGRGALDNLWGFANPPVEIAFMSLDYTEHWFWLRDLAGPTGLSETELFEKWRAMFDDADTDVDKLTWIDPATKRIRFQAIVNRAAVMRLFLEGPWGNEFARNLYPALQRQAVVSGAGDTITTDDGRTLTEAILADGPLPDAEEARLLANRGPSLNPVEP